MNVAGRSRPVPLSDVKKRGYADYGGSASMSSSSADVDMYLDVPSFELSLDEFEEYALARLKVRPSLQTVVGWYYHLSVELRGMRGAVQLNYHQTAPHHFLFCIIYYVSPELTCN